MFGLGLEWPPLLLLKIRAGLLSRTEDPFPAARQWWLILFQSYFLLLLLARRRPRARVWAAPVAAPLVAALNSLVDKQKEQTFAGVKDFLKTRGAPLACSSIGPLQ